MFNTLKTAALSLAIGMGAISAAPVAAQAEGIYFRLGTDNGRYHEVQDEYRLGTRSYRRDGRRCQYREEYRRERCSPRDAERKARRLGLRNARVVDVDRRSVTVRGRAFGERAMLVFGRNSSCPVIARY